MCAVTHSPELGRRMHDQAEALAKTLRYWALASSPEALAYRRIKPMEDALADVQRLAEEIGHDASPVNKSR